MVSGTSSLGSEGGLSIHQPAGAQALVLPGMGLVRWPVWPNLLDGLKTSAASVPLAVTPLGEWLEMPCVPLSKLFCRGI